VKRGTTSPWLDLAQRSVEVLRAPPRLSLRRERRALTAIARFLPAIAGIVLTLTFSLSVLRDSADIARPAWTEGSDLLAVYGGFGLVVLPFIGLFTARLRRGAAAPVLDLRLRGGTLFVRARRERESLTREDVAGVHTAALGDGRVRVALTLRRGLETGDRVVLEGPIEELSEVVRHFDGSLTTYELTRKALWPGVVMAALSAALGALLGGTLFDAVRARAVAIGVATTSTLEAWSTAAFVAGASFVGLVLSLALAARTVKVGLDGVLCEGPLRSRFIPAAELSGAAVLGPVLVVRRVSGSPVLVPIAGCDPTTVQSLLHDLEELRARQGRTSSDVSPIPALVAKWRDALRSDVDRSYREAAPHVDDLARAVREPGLALEDRIGAARVLLARRIEPAQHVVIAAAERMVLAENRDALLRLAEDESELSPDASEPRRRVS
jgi:hypothetical protein